MPKCDNCGNDYEHTFDVVLRGELFSFDSFQCAINKLAPHCAACDSLIIGHGIEYEDFFYCCSHCARAHNAKLSLADFKVANDRKSHLKRVNREHL